MNSLYPLIFKPVYKEKLWGGERLHNLPGLSDAGETGIGEAWVLSGLKEGPTLVANGFLTGNTLDEITEIYMDELVGEKVYDKFGEHFPLLLKIIDASDKLSVQVHPDDITAERFHYAPNGKSEMWYILDAEPESWIVNGFARNTSKEEYLDFLKNNKISELLKFVNVKKDDVYFLPAGRIHAVGSGILFAEIQQASDFTYRIYDWDRVDRNNQARELHLDLALEAVDFIAPSSIAVNYKSIINRQSTLVDDPAFYSSLIAFDSNMKRDFHGSDTFVAYLCLEGSLRIHADTCDNNTYLKTGNAALVPANIPEFVLIPEGNAKILEVYLR